nr:hypothetical protein Iba_chr02dCG2750 [Ipomoea batatas]
MVEATNQLAGEEEPRQCSLSVYSLRGRDGVAGWCSPPDCHGRHSTSSTTPIPLSVAVTVKTERQKFAAAASFFVQPARETREPRELAKKKKHDHASSSRDPEIDEPMQDMEEPEDTILGAMKLKLNATRLAKVEKLKKLQVLGGNVAPMADVAARRSQRQPSERRTFTLSRSPLLEAWMKQTGSMASSSSLPARQVIGAEGSRLARLRWWMAEDASRLAAVSDGKHRRRSSSPTLKRNSVAAVPFSPYSSSSISGVSDGGAGQRRRSSTPAAKPPSGLPSLGRRRQHE